MNEVTCWDHVLIWSQWFHRLCKIDYVTLIFGPDAICDLKSLNRNVIRHQVLFPVAFIVQMNADNEFFLFRCTDSWRKNCAYWRGRRQTSNKHNFLLFFLSFRCLCNSNVSLLFDFFGFPYNTTKIMLFLISIVLPCSHNYFLLLSLHLKQGNEWLIDVA